MRATIYQESSPRARSLAGALLALGALGALASLASCRGAGRPVAALPTPVTDAGVGPAVPLDGRSLHFTRLQSFTPDALLEFKGGKATASTARFGEVAVSEVERAYGEGERTAKIRIVDTSLNRGAHPPEPGAAFEDERKVGRPLHTAGASGYVEFEKESRRAVANLIVASRVLVTISCEGARGPEDVERLAAALDLRRLESLLREKGAP
jgi:hypothetical protein